MEALKRGSSPLRWRKTRVHRDIAILLARTETISLFFSSFFLFYRFYSALQIVVNLEANSEMNLEGNLEANLDNVKKLCNDKLIA